MTAKKISLSCTQTYSHLFTPAFPVCRTVTQMDNMHFSPNVPHYINPKKCTLVLFMGVITEHNVWSICNRISFKMDELQRQYRHKQVGWQGREINDFFQSSLPHIVKNTIKWPDKCGFLLCIYVFPIKIGS